MKILKRLNSPKFLIWFHGCLTVFWILLWVAAVLFGWINSVAFVSHLSVIALILASLAAWQAAHGERKEDKD